MTAAIVILAIMYLFGTAWMITFTDDIEKLWIRWLVIAFWPVGLVALLLGVKSPEDAP